ncbi:WYL domain-containing protein [Saccharopolyspora spinosa]|uniref:WYL domain-containing protein n=1 Tax=Saccharopolyspora spinosa TaxID=60894 RepID=UPI003078D83C
MQTYTVPVPRGGPAVEADVLTTTARACRDRAPAVRLPRATTPRACAPSSRIGSSAPGIVGTGRRWHLVGWHCDRDDWRSFRVDRLSSRIPTGAALHAASLPEGGFAA